MPLVRPESLYNQLRAMMRLLEASMSSAPGRLHLVLSDSIPASWLLLIISSGCLLFSVMGVSGFVADFDTLRTFTGEFGDDDTPDVWV